MSGRLGLSHTPFTHSPVELCTLVSVPRALCVVCRWESAFYAARLAGGVDVYIPASNFSYKVEDLESDAFKQRLLHGWRKV